MKNIKYIEESGEINPIVFDRITRLKAINKSLQLSVKKAKSINSALKILKQKLES